MKLIFDHPFLCFFALVIFEKIASTNPFLGGLIVVMCFVAWLCQVNESKSEDLDEDDD